MDNTTTHGSPLTVRMNGCQREYATLYPFEDQKILQVKYLDKGYLCFWGENRMLGVMDYRGKVIIAPRWKDIYIQAEAGIFTCVLDNRTVLFDFNGKTLTGLSVDKLLSMSIGTAVIDIDGKIILVDRLEAYFDGLARAICSGRTYYIDTTGHVVLRLNEGYSGAAFHCGRALVQRNNGWFKKKTYGFIAKNGKTVVPTEHYKLREFSGDLAAMRSDRGWKIIRKDGTPLECYRVENGERAALTPFADLTDFINGYAAVLCKGKSHADTGLDSSLLAYPEALSGWGILHESGELTSPIWYNELIPTGVDDIFILNSHRNENQQKKFGLVNARGVVLLKEEYSEIRCLEEDYFAVCKNGKWGIADKSGRVISNPQWDSLGKVQNGTFNVYRDGHWGLLDQQGNVLLPPAFDIQILLHDGVAMIVQNGEPRFLNLQKQPAFPEKFFRKAVYHRRHGLGGQK